jgi:hypothetical protein
MYVDKEIEIDIDDVFEYISSYATDSQLKDILSEIETRVSVPLLKNLNDLEGSYIREEKQILLNLAAKKYSLEELEKRLGNKFDLI